MKHGLHGAEANSLASQFLPDRPALLVHAAALLYPDAEQTGERRPFQECALRLLREQRGEKRPQDLRLERSPYAVLGQPAKALTTYRAALALDPAQARWRCEFARLLYQGIQLQAAQAQLRMALRDQPDNQEVRDFLETVRRELAGEN